MYCPKTFSINPNKNVHFKVFETDSCNLSINQDTFQSNDFVQRQSVRGVGFKYNNKIQKVKIETSISVRVNHQPEIDMQNVTILLT